VPQGSDFELCVAVAREQRILSEACEGRVVVDEVCQAVPEDSEVVSFRTRVVALCGVNDSVRLLVRVHAPEGTAPSCQPYTLTFTSREL
jgi:hypothetical protein